MGSIATDLHVRKAPIASYCSLVLGLPGSVFGGLHVVQAWYLAGALLLPVPVTTS